MRILHVLSELDNGGVAHLLYEYCSRMASDIHFDFVVKVAKEGAVEKKLKNMGCCVYHIPQIRENILLHNRMLGEVLKGGNYDIVHEHGDFQGIWTMIIAKKHGILCRISHAHRTSVSETKLGRVQSKLLIPLTKWYATDLCACGSDAAISVWGKKAFSKNQVHIIHNAIELEKYSFSEEIRERVREALGIQDKLVIGNVARFAYQKNHEFLVEIFRKLKEKDSNAVLLLVGNGDGESRIRQLVQEYGIEKDVLFLGARGDVPELLSAMDVFVLPSRYEGLPIVLVEVQANGLAAVVSDSVTKEVCILNNINYLSLSFDAYEWVKEIIELKDKRLDNTKGMSKYDINFAVEDLKQYYQSLIRL